MNRNINRLKFGGDFGAEVAWVAEGHGLQRVWMAKGVGSVDGSGQRAWDA